MNPVLGQPFPRLCFAVGEERAEAHLGRGDGGRGSLGTVFEAEGGSWDRAEPSPPSWDLGTAGRCCR